MTSLKLASVGLVAGLRYRQLVFGLFQPMRTQSGNRDGLGVAYDTELRISGPGVVCRDCLRNIGAEQERGAATR
jgi:hypothetical protein